MARAHEVQLLRRYDPSLPALWADADRLIQVFQNLVQNGIEAMPGGGRLDFRARRTDGHLELEVADTGTGIAPEDEPRIFSAFFTSCFGYRWM